MAWALVLVGLALTGTADALTGELWFGPFYLLTIGFAAWGLGPRQAICVGVAAIALVVWANGLALFPFGTVAAAWNLAMRISMVVMAIGLISRARQSYTREWRLARTDPLTGALNRQAFFERADSSSASAGWTMFAYADLDGLKKLNDERGHLAGDLCLKTYVAHVRSVIREHDHFARLGGDEFVIQMKVPDEVSARSVAERLHREMNKVTADIHPQLKCSVGVLILPPGERMFDREVLTADQLMYEAKQLGAGLVVATLREVHGTRFLLQHWTTDAGIGTNQVLTDQFTRLEDRQLHTAA